MRSRWSVKTAVIDPSSQTYGRWLTVVSCAVIYNLVIIIARTALKKMDTYCRWIFVPLDLTADAVYIVDIVVNFRIGE